MKTPPGRCIHVAIVLGVALVLGLLFGGTASADGPKKKALEAGSAAAPAGKPAGNAAENPAGKREKTYNFGGLDIDGKLKTPQLLYFLNRMKSEFDTTTPDKRSFIPELKRSTDEM